MVVGILEEPAALEAVGIDEGGDLEQQRRNLAALVARREGGRARLYMDAEEVDRENVFYGDEQLEATLPDGTTVVVSIDSGMIGELTKAQLRQPDGSWIDLEERQPQAE